MRIKLVTVEQMRAIEQATDAAGTSYDEMMQYAGQAVAETVKQLLERGGSGQRVAVLVGPGNNGGDGLVAACVLAEETDAEVGCYLLKARTDDDEVYIEAREAGVFIATAEDDTRWRVLKNLVGSADIVVDALLGTGARLPIEGDLQKLLTHAANAITNPPLAVDEWIPPTVWPALPVGSPQHGKLVVAVDCPSGLDSDTGELDPVAIPADYTVTFAAAKRGQVIFPGARAVGELIVADIGTPDDLAELEAIDLDLASAALIKGLLPARSIDSHKGTYGRTAVIAGSINYVGAASLASEAAYRAGTGLVTAAVPASIHAALAAGLREATWILLPQDMGVISEEAVNVLQDELGEVNAVLLGPGLGHEEATDAFIRRLFQGQQRAHRGSLGFGNRAEAAEASEDERFEFNAPLVIDADGLNLLSRIDDWWTTLPEGTVLTPHPGEMARLSQLEMDAIQADRIGIARAKAADWGCVLALKGAYTVVAAPDGRTVVIPIATDALATAGTGDVLSGCIAGFASQGLDPFDAAVVGAYVHGIAGRLAGEGGSSRSTVAGDVLAALSHALALIEAS